MTAKKQINIIHRGSGKTLLTSVRWCDSFFCKLRGLQFRRTLLPGEGILLVYPRDSIAATSIHMFNVFFPIAAVWINNDGKVTSAQLAKPWHPYYASPKPARYILEAEAGLLEKVSPGDRLEFLQIR